MDYAALAQKYNGKVDYAGLAKQNGGFPKSEPSSVTQTFNSKLGKNGLPPSQSPFNPHNSAMAPTDSNSANSINYKAPSPVKNFVSSVIPAIKQTGVTVIKDTGQGYMDMTKGFGQDFQNLNQHSQEVASGGGQSWSTLKPQAKMGADILSMAAHGVEGVFSPLTAIFKQGIEPEAQALQNMPGFSKVANSSAGDMVDNLNQKAASLQQTNPTKFKAVQDAVNVIMALVGEGEANKAPKTIGEPIKNFGAKIENGMSNATDSIKAQVGNAVQDFRDVSAGKAEVKANSLSGKITQGEIGDVPRAKNVLSNIDLADVQKAPEGQKTQALKNTLDQSVKTQSESIDQTLGSDKRTFKMADTGTKVGSKISNPVQEGIDQLKQYYQDTNNAKAEAKITALEQKANSQGLTLREINNLAKEQGVAIDAYKANGDLASSKAKIAAENTRMGIKQTVDRLSGSDVFGEADSQLSDTMRVRDLMDTRAEAVQKLQQKIIEQPWYKKLGNKGAKLIDMLTGGNLKSAVNYFIPRGEGLKTLNALDLEKSLQKDLMKLQDLTNTKSSSELQTKLNEYISEQSGKPEPGQTTQSTVEASDLGNKKMPSTIKVNDYRSSFPKYFTQDQINSAAEMLKQLENWGKTIDMKQVNTVVKQVKQMSDVKLNSGVKNGRQGNVVVRSR